MLPIPPAETPGNDAFTTVARLTILQTQNEHVSNTYTQPRYTNLTLANQNANNSPHNQNIHPHDQSTAILQQFSMITQELRNFTEHPVTLTESGRHVPLLKKILAN